MSDKVKWRDAKALRDRIEELEEEVKGALAIIVAQRSENQRLREENRRWRGVAKWYDDTMEKHITATGKPARIRDETGAWHDGPAADITQKILRGLQNVLRAALKGEE